MTNMNHLLYIYIQNSKVAMPTRAFFSFHPKTFNPLYISPNIFTETHFTHSQQNHRTELAILYNKELEGGKFCNPPPPPPPTESSQFFCTEIGTKNTTTFVLTIFPYVKSSIKNQKRHIDLTFFTFL